MPQLDVRGERSEQGDAFAEQDRDAARRDLVEEPRREEALDRPASVDVEPLEPAGSERRPDLRRLARHRLHATRERRRDGKRRCVSTTTGRSYGHASKVSTFSNVPRPITIPSIPAMNAPYP